MSTRIGMALAFATALLGACAGRREPPAAGILRGNRADDVSARLYVGPRLPGGALALVEFQSVKYAVVAQVTEGRVDLLFPEGDNATGRVRPPYRRTFEVDTTQGPVFVILSDREAMHLTTLMDSRGFLPWYSKSKDPRESPDSTILRFAEAVADPTATIVRAERFEWEPRAPMPSDLRRAERWGRGRNYDETQCRPVVMPPRPASSDTAMSRPDAPRDPARDRVVCDRP